MTDTQDIPAVFNNDTLLDEEGKALEKKAQTVIDSLQETFLAGARESAKRLLSLLETAKTKSSAEQGAFLKEFLYPIAHDLKGQGTTFGYPLLTSLAARVCAHINKVQNWSREDLTACEQNILDMQTVLSYPPNTQNTKLTQIKTKLETTAP